MAQRPGRRTALTSDITNCTEPEIEIKETAPRLSGTMRLKTTPVRCKNNQQVYQD